jgi:murein DD-endopeptidase MepM/ murein hydrolase activator NlpD
VFIVLLGLLVAAIGVAIVAVATWVFRRRIRPTLRRGVHVFAGIFGCAYLLFVALLTGPRDLSTYPDAASSPYRLPWEAGIVRWVAQGNRSFTSHRGVFLYSWDFWMPVGTPVLVARDGLVVAAEDDRDGVGWFEGNHLLVRHRDDTKAIYAHLQRGSIVVGVGDRVIRGQRVARSGMVGRTLFPHLHFAVLEGDGSSSVPIAFGDVPSGVPLAWRWYTSENVRR